MCGVTLRPAWATSRAIVPPAGLGRAARFAFRLTLAGATTACGARTDLTNEEASVTEDAALRADASAPRDAGGVRDGGRDAGGDGGFDAGSDAGEISVPLYGAPPLPEPPEQTVAVRPADAARVERRKRKR